MKLATRANRFGAVRRPTTIGERRARGWATLLAMVGFAYVFWSRATDGGIVGWFDAIQARGGGRYNETLSFMLSVFAVMVAAFLVTMPLARLGPSARQKLPTAIPAAPADAMAFQSRMLPRVGLGLIIAIWIVGFGTFEYYTRRTTQEIQAHYEPVDVAAPVGRAADMQFVALRGKVHPLGYIKQTENREPTGTFFIPIVAPSTRDPHVPVHWFVRTKGTGDPYLSPTIYAHALGLTIPQTLRDAFAKDGINIAPDAVLVSYVETDGSGQVLDGSENYLPIFLGGCAFLSVMVVMTLGAFWLRYRMHHRRLMRSGTAFR